MVQTCQVNWQITIPAGRLALQINKTDLTDVAGAATALQRVNFTGNADQQAVISANSLSDLCTNNSVSVSPLESIVAGKRHCGTFIDIPVTAFSATAGRFNYLLSYPITFSGILDLNQLNPIINSFPVLTRNYASLYLQLWTQDFLQDLKIVWLNKTNMVTNEHLAYQMISPEKPDIIFLRNRDEVAYDAYTVRIVNMEGKPNTEKFPTNSISQIKDAKFDKLDISNITMYMTFAMNQYPTWFFPVLLQKFDLIIDQRHLIPEAYTSLNPM
ncbi:MAG: hypothetical protein EZS28_047577, partial [Streblomastix strix]